jgi:hypothetical protein
MESISVPATLGIAQKNTRHAEESESEAASTEKRERTHEEEENAHVTHPS